MVSHGISIQFQTYDAVRLISSRDSNDVHLNIEYQTSDNTVCPTKIATELPNLIETWRMQSEMLLKVKCQGKLDYDRNVLHSRILYWLQNKVTNILLGLLQVHRD